MNRPHRQLGFSLIELTVVLVLVSLATAMVVPNLSSAYSNLQARTELDEMLITLEGVGYEAFVTGRGLRIDSNEAARRLLKPREGWRISVVTPVIVRANGICLGGELRFDRAEFSQSVILRAPHCNAVRESNAF